LNLNKEKQYENKISLSKFTIDNKQMLSPKEIHNTKDNNYVKENNHNISANIKDKWDKDNSKSKNDLSSM
jgi:hypothetical protein